MPILYKALVVVIAFTVGMFVFLAPLMCRFMRASDFRVRRNAWLALSAAAFLIPYYWAYVVVAVIILLWAAKTDSNPAAFYVFMLLAMVPIGLPLPTFGLVNQIFLLDHLRLLSLVILLPQSFRLLRAGTAASNGASDADHAAKSVRRYADGLIIIYLAMQIAVLTPYESPTATLRRMVLAAVDVWLPYYVLSRSCGTRSTLIEVLAAFCLALLVLTPLAVFEFFRGWLLYAGLQEQWGTAPIVNYLTRGDFLRAQVTAGHSIVLGFAMAVALGFWLFLQSRVVGATWRWCGSLLLLVGLAMPSARGPWVGALAIVSDVRRLSAESGRDWFSRR